MAHSFAVGAAAVLLLALGGAAVREDLSLVLEAASEREEVETDRSSNVRVINLTGRRITAVALVHRYSDDAPEKFAVGALEDGEESPRFTVNYRTGFLRTGQDWWKIAWCSSDGTQFFVSNPNNFRGFVDFLEKTFTGTLGGLVSSTLTVVTLGVPITTGGGKKLGAAVADSIAGRGGTEGYKSFVLTADDEGKTATIKLLPHGRIEMEAPSGKADTVYVEKHLEDQRARAVVINRTGKRISALALAHKYSNDEPETTSFGHLDDGQTSPPLDIFYRTGFLRTGADWWKLAWFSSDGSDLFVTQTGGMSTFLNGLETFALGHAVDLALSTATGFTVDGILTDAVSDALGRQMAHTFAATHGEGGYEKHTLTTEDAGRTVTLTVHPGGLVQVSSTSSASEISYVKVGEGTATKMAKAVVINRTGKRIVGVALVHKYSDDTPEVFTKNVLEDGEETPKFTVHFRTGFLRTGADWWQVAWCSTDGSEVFASQGGALNGVVDVLGAMLTSTVGSAVQVGLISAGVPVAAPVGGQLAQTVADSLVGQGGTAGYEKLALSSVDVDGVVTITLLPAGADNTGTVEIRAPSGATETGYKKEKR